MDFIGPFPTTSKNKFDNILTVVDRLTKRVRFIPCQRDITAVQTARLFYDNIISQHGLPKSIVSDRDFLFTSAFWSELFKLLGTTLALSTVDHAV